MLYRPLSKVATVALLATLMSSSSTGCLGPIGLYKTRCQYNEAVQTTNDEELLLNLVRLRYSEGVMFLRVTGVNAQFELNALTQILGGLQRGDTSGFGSGQLGFVDRPTLTFDPRRDPIFTQALLTPINLETINTLDAAGWDQNRLFRFWIKQLNGVDNAVEAGGPTPALAPEFGEFRVLLTMLLQLADQRLVGFAVRPVEKDVPAAVPVDSVDATNLVRARAIITWTT